MRKMPKGSNEFIILFRTMMALWDYLFERDHSYYLQYIFERIIGMFTKIITIKSIEIKCLI